MAERASYAASMSWMVRTLRPATSFHPGTALPARISPWAYASRRFTQDFKNCALFSKAPTSWLSS